MTDQGISDDEISCQIPDSCPDGISTNINYFQLVVKICQISSQAMSNLSSARALRQSPEELISAVSALDGKARDLSLSLNSSGILRKPSDLREMHADLSESQMLSIHFLYHALILDIHSALAFPWPYRTSNLVRRAEFRDQIEQSSALVADTSRNVILALRSVHVDANSSVL